MNEQNLIDTLGQLTVDIDDLTTHRDGNDTLWINSYCPLAPYTHTSGESSNHSFGVSVDESDNSVYYCFSCGAKGTLSTLARTLAGYTGDNKFHKISTQITLIEAIKEKPSWETRRKQKGIKKKALKPEIIPESDFDKFTPVKNYPIAYNYLKRRGVGVGTSESLDLRYDDYRQRILTPLRGLDGDLDGDLYGWQGRTVLAEKDYPDIRDKKTGRKINYPKTMNSKGLKKELNILGLSLWGDNDKPILVIESPMAYAILIENNIEKYFRVACILGSDLSDYQATLIVQQSKNKPVLLMFDLDNAGDKGIFGVKQPDGTYKGGALQKLKPHVKVIVPEYPNGKEDLDDFDEKDIKDMYCKYFNEPSVKPVSNKNEN